MPRPCVSLSVTDYYPESVHVIAIAHTEDNIFHLTLSLKTEGRR